MPAGGKTARNKREYAPSSGFRGIFHIFVAGLILFASVGCSISGRISKFTSPAELGLSQETLTLLSSITTDLESSLVQSGWDRANASDASRRILDSTISSLRQQKLSQGVLSKVWAYLTNDSGHGLVLLTYTEIASDALAASSLEFTHRKIGLKAALSSLAVSTLKSDVSLDNDDRLEAVAGIASHVQSRLRRAGVASGTLVAESSALLNGGAAALSEKHPSNPLREKATAKLLEGTISALAGLALTPSDLRAALQSLVGETLKGGFGTTSQPARDPKFLVEEVVSGTVRAIANQITDSDPSATHNIIDRIVAGAADAIKTAPAPSAEQAQKRAESIGGIGSGLIAALEGKSSSVVLDAIEHVSTQVVSQLPQLNLSDTDNATAIENLAAGLMRNLDKVDLDSGSNLVDVGTRIATRINETLSTNPDFSTTTQIGSIGAIAEGLLEGLAPHSPSNSTLSSLVANLTSQAVEKIPDYGFSPTQLEQAAAGLAQGVFNGAHVAGWTTASDFNRATAALNTGILSGVAATSGLTDSQKSAVISGVVAGSVPSANLIPPSPPSNQNGFIETAVRTALESASSGILQPSHLPNAYTDILSNATSALSEVAQGDSNRAGVLAGAVATGARESLTSPDLSPADKLDLLQASGKGVIGSLTEAGVATAHLENTAENVVKELLSSLTDIGLPTADLSKAVQSVVHGAVQGTADLGNAAPSTIVAVVNSVVRGATQAIDSSGASLPEKEDALKSVITGAIAGIGEDEFTNTQAPATTQQVISTVVTTVIGQVTDIGWTGPATAPVVSGLVQHATQTVTTLPVTNVNEFNPLIGSVSSGANAGLPQLDLSSADKIAMIKTVTEQTVANLISSGVPRELLPGVIERVVSEAVLSIDDFGLTPAETASAIKSLTEGVMAALPALNTQNTEERQNLVSAISSGITTGLSESTFNEAAKIGALSGAAAGLVAGMTDAGLPSSSVSAVISAGIETLVTRLPDTNIAPAQIPAAVQAVVSNAVANLGSSGVASEAERTDLVQDISSAAAQAIAQSSLADATKGSSLQAVASGAISNLPDAGITTSPTSSIESIVSTVVKGVEAAGLPSATVPQTVAGVATGAISVVDQAGLASDAEKQAAIAAIVGSTIATLGQTNLPENVVTQSVTAVTNSAISALPESGLPPSSAESTVVAIVKEAIEAIGAISETKNIDNTELTTIANNIANGANTSVSDLSTSSPAFLPPADVGSIHTSVQNQASTSTGVVTDTVAPTLTASFAGGTASGAAIPGLTVYQGYFTDLDFSPVATDNSGQLKGIYVRTSPTKGSLNCSPTSLICRYTNSDTVAYSPNDSFVIQITDAAGNRSPQVTVTLAVTAKESRACSPANSAADGIQYRNRPGQNDWTACSGFTCQSGFESTGDLCVQSSYTLAYSTWGACDALVCSGSGTQTRSISSCIRTSDNRTVSTIFCAPGASLSRSCDSPFGIREIAISHGTQTQSCAAASTSWAPSSVVCNTGYTEGALFSCDPVDCNALTVANGSVATTGGTTYGNTATYSCDSGYRLSGGSLSRTCQAGGTWSGTAPSCSLISRTLTLAAGATVTNSALVPVVVSSDVTHQMAIFENGTCTGASTWRSYSSSFTHDFGSAPDGTLTLSAKFRDAQGQESLCVSSSIALDTQPPSILLVGAPNGYSGLPTLNVSVSSLDATHYRYKWGPSLTTDCAVASGYGGERPVSEPITDTVGLQGSMLLCVIARDEANNYQSFASATQSAWVQDSTEPTVVSVTALNGSGAYKASTAISIQVQFSESVEVTGVPSLTLNTAPVQREAIYSEGTGSNTLTFVYNVQAGDTAGTLDYAATSAFILDSGVSIKDPTGNDADLTLPALGSPGSISGSKTIVIDTTAPVAPSSVTLIDPLTYPSTDTTPTFRIEGLETGATVTLHADNACATTIRASGTVTSGNSIDLTTSPLPNGVYSFYAKQTDAAGNASPCTTTGAEYEADSSSPTVTHVTASNSDGHYGIGQTIDIEIHFNEPVVVTGTPSLTVGTSPIQRTALYSSGSGDSILVFRYTVQSGDTSARLDYASVSALSFNGGTIKDLTDIEATLDLPAPGAAGSLGANANLIIDTTAPTAPTVALLTPLSSPGNNLTPTMRISGVENGATVSIHADSSCATTALASGTASASAIDLTSGSLTEGNHTIYARQSDLAGNVSPCSTAGVAYVIDISSPTVSEITSTTPNGSYRAGQAIVIEVAFDETVVVTGTPLLALNTTPTSRNASYFSGSGSNTLVFTYTVQATDTAAELDYSSTSALSLAGGTIRDSAGNNAVLTLAAPGAAGSLGANASLIIDTTAPAAPTVALQSPATSPNTVATPTLRVSGVEVGATVALHTDNACATASVATGTASASAIDLTVPTLSAGTHTFYAKQTDAAGNVSSCSTAGIAYTLDLTAPIVSNITASPPSGAYKADGVISIHVVFSENVDVTGTPLLALNTTPTSRNASYFSGSGSNTLVFTYTVQATDTAAELDYSSTSALSLAGGTIRDSAGNNAVLTLAAPGAVGSLGANASLIIDTTAPAAPTVALQSPATSPGNIATPVVRVNGTEASATVSLHTDNLCATTARASSVSAGGSIDLTSSTLPEGSYSFYAKQVDAAGNVSDCSATGVAYILDLTVPRVTSLSSSTANGAYSTGAAISITIHFDDTVLVTGTPLLTLNTTPTPRAASYVSGSGSSTLTFSYTVQAGDTSADLDHASTTSLALNNGSIKDGSGNDADLTLPSPGGANSIANGKNIVIDTTAPATPTLALQVPATSPGNNTTPTLRVSGLETGAAVSIHTDSLCSATANASGTAAGVTLDLTSSTLTAGSYTFYARQTDLAGNVSSCSAAGAAYILDLTAPTVTNITSTTANGAYTTGTTIPIQVSFSEAVNVTGSPYLTLNTSPARQATYSSGSGSDTLVFSYTVQSGDASSDLDYASTSALSLNGGTIRDTATNGATLTLPTPGAAGSLAANKAIIIDTGAGDTPTIALQSPASTPNTVTTPTFRISGVEIGATVTLHTDSSCSTAARATGTASGASIDLTSSSLTQGSYTFYAKQTDAAGNASECASPGASYTLDLTAPTVTNVTFTVSEKVSWIEMLEGVL